ncbi:MAG: hypothetical protein NVS2B16_08410 [Chloroflexota bacterium]
MDKTQTENVSNRMNDLALESTQTLIDAAYLAQRQSAQLIQAWLNTLDANQQQSRDVAGKLLQQSQEAQKLLQEYVRDTVRTNADAFNQASQAGYANFTQGFSQVAEQVGNATQRTANATQQAAETAQRSTGNNKNTK